MTLNWKEKHIPRVFLLHLSSYTFLTSYNTLGTYHIHFGLFKFLLFLPQFLSMHQLHPEVLQKENDELKSFGDNFFNQKYRRCSFFSAIITVSWKVWGYGISAMKLADTDKKGDSVMVEQVLYLDCNGYTNLHM